MTAAEHNHTNPASAPTATDEERSEARARMRRKLADARYRHDDAYWARLREQLDLPARAT